MSILEDGMGTGKKASVSINNRLNTSSKTESRIYYHSRDDESAYSVYGKRNFVAADTEENILYIKNIGNNDLYIKSIMFSTDSDLAKIEVFFAATSISGGEEIIPLNMNRGSANESETECLHGGSTLIGTVDDALEFFDVRLSKNSFLMDFNSAIIIQKNKNIFFKGSVAAIGDKIRITVYYFESP